MAGQATRTIGIKMVATVLILILIGLGYLIYFCWPLILALGIIYIIWLIWPTWLLSFFLLCLVFFVIGILGTFIAANFQIIKSSLIKKQ